MGAHTGAAHDLRQDTSRYRIVPQPDVFIERSGAGRAARLPAGFPFSIPKPCSWFGNGGAMSEAIVRTETPAGDTTRSFYRTLKLVSGIVPIVAGLDRFPALLVDGIKYIAPPIASM